jgi:predicted acylesterase/phospholipase RssA/uncharacterized protein YndB with AHSA1/START domain
MFEGTQTGGPLAPELDGPPRRALILAGGGLKVAFQAGVLQVWLDEAREGGQRLEFLHADGASGGVFNLAMWCQGMSGAQIAENWRRTAPVHQGLSLNWRGWPRGESIFTMRRFRTRVLHDTWGLDWQQIRASSASATFNVFDGSAQRLLTVAPAQMSEDLLLAATSLPGWYPPVTVNGARYIDGVFVTDANLEAAIAAGANELWVIWTVSTAGRWRTGPVAEYFQVIEACANGALHRDLDRIARSNQAHAEGSPAQYPHSVRIVPLIQEVPLHYLFAFTRRAVAAAVDLGVQRARQWCRERGLDVRVESGPATAGARGAVRRSLTFRESMVGPVDFGCPDALVSAQLGDARGQKMTLRLTVKIDDVDAFLAEGQHRSAVSGSLHCQVLGGVLPIERGSVTVLSENGTGRAEAMQYQLDVTDQTGRKLTLLGIKNLRNDSGLELWQSITTLDVWLFLRQHHLNGAQPAGTPVLSGRLRLSLRSLLRQLRTFHVTDSTPLSQVRTILALADLVLRRAARGNGSTVSEFDQWPHAERPEGAKVFAHNERIIPAAPEHVWSLLVDAHGWSQFYGNAHFVELTDPQQHNLRRGSVFRWVTFGLPLTSEVAPCKRPLHIGWRWSWRWWGTGWHGYHIWLLEPHPYGTRIVTEETNRGLLPNLLYPAIQPMIRLEHNSWLRGLARQAVAHPRPVGT